MRTLVLLLTVFVVSVSRAWAHGGHAHEHPALTWTFDWWVLLGIALTGALYWIGVVRMRRRAGPGRVIGRSQIAAFAGGMLVLFLTLESPIDTVADQLFSVHMVQHMLLLFVVPPLLVWGRPPVAFMWAFRSRSRRVLGNLWTRLRLNRVVQALMHPSVVWVAFTGSFVFWHFPKPFQWALENEGIHTLEHLCFLITGLMFWTIVIEPSGRRRLSYGATLVHVATTAILGGLPGALILLAQYPLYPVQTAGAAAWGLTPMQDQQLAGVIMWVPGGFAYVATVSWIFARWMEDAERQERKRAARAWVASSLLAIFFIAACAGSQAAHARILMARVSGNPQRGATLIKQFGCGSCHAVPGVSGADGKVGPPLGGIADRIYVAGMLRNTPDNMARWLMHPQQIVPGNAMPDMGVSTQQARDMAAYLATLH